MQTVIRADRVFDGTGDEPIEHGVVVLEDGLIREVGERGTVREPQSEADVFDFDGCTMLPGLIDGHVHLVFSTRARPLADLLADDDQTLLVRAVHNAQVALQAGVTTVKDLGDRRGVLFALRDAIARCILPGARILAAGPPITTTGGHCHWLGGEADTIDDLRRAVRGLVKAGADIVKVMATGGRMTAGTNVTAAQYSVEELTALVDDARRLDRTVIAHCHGTAGIRNAVAAGVNVVEHCTWIAAGASDEVDYDLSVARQMAEKGVFMSTTLAPHELHTRLDPSLRSATFPETEKIRPQVVEAHRQSIAAGVEIACGTDAGVAHAPLDTLLLEINLLHERLGLSPAAALRAATFNGARSAGKESELGSLQPGRRGDVLVVEGNPLRKLRDLYHTRAVFKDGVLEVENGRLVRA